MQGARGGVKGGRVDQYMTIYPRSLDVSAIYSLAQTLTRQYSRLFWKADVVTYPQPDSGKICGHDLEQFGEVDFRPHRCQNS